MITRVLIFTLVLISFVSSCSKAPENLATREIIDGIEYVHNTVEPLYPDASLFLELELSIGGEDQEGNVVLYELGSTIVDDAENVYIADWRDFNIKVFDPEGNHTHSIGKKGEGPGEFQYIANIMFTPDSRLLVMDFRARRTSLFQRTGDFISSHSWKFIVSQPVFATNSSYFVKELEREGESAALENLKLLIDEIDFDGNKLNKFEGFQMPEIKSVRYENAISGISLPHSPRSLFAGDILNQCWFHCINDQYLIEVYDTDGKIFRKIDRPYEALPYTKQDKEKFLARYENQPDEKQMKLVDSMEYPSIKNIVEFLFIDDEGNLWVQTNETKEEGGEELIAFDIFSKDGSYTYKVWLKGVPVAIRKSKLYYHHSDEETGYTFIQRYKMIWSD